jgi:ABC-2 type transport system permease protein
VSLTPAAPPPSVGRLVIGPTALGDDPRRFWNLTLTLAITDFKLKFFGSVLGYLWQLMKPLMLFGVLYLVFSVALKFGGPERFYPQALLLGIVLFSFFAEATSGSVRSLLLREPLVRKVDFPRLAVPLSVVLVALFNLALNLVPVLLFLVAAGAPIRLSWLELVPLIAILTLFALGLSMLLSVLFVSYRDVEPIWDVVLQAMFYGSGIFFTVEVLRAKIGDATQWLMCNPMAAILQQARHSFIDPSHPSLLNAMNGDKLLLMVPLGLVLVTFVAGFLVFRHEAPRVAELL